ncbi:MAG: Nramp family divalent metal transporter [Gammaproteobacteria bacterium]|nr:Nramp family divalent metal transporter [Gammaproteobacteria bacterium]
MAASAAAPTAAAAARSRVLRKLRSIGPGAVAAAAFIGPGTVTTATVAGATYGYDLAWALVFATAAAIVLQEMAARLGVVARIGLGEAVLAISSRSRALRGAASVLIVAALFVGNAAYEGGNIAGAALGAAAVTDGLPRGIVSVAIAVAAGALLVLGGYRAIERVLIAMVASMSLAFLIAAIIVRPDVGALLPRLVTPRLTLDAAPLVLGLVGTTIVPYNLFLHAAAARTKWPGAASLGDARFDTCFSIGVGGIVSILILVTAAASLFGSGAVIASAADMARQLEPAFGAAAMWLLALGLFAAGLTSAITAPLASAYAAAELFGFRSDPKSVPFRAVALTILLVGTVAAVTGRQPVELILFAQFANGLLLPIVAAFLLYAVNRRALLGQHVNGLGANLPAIAVIAVAIVLGGRALVRVAASF